MPSSPASRGEAVVAAAHLTGARQALTAAASPTAFDTRWRAIEARKRNSVTAAQPKPPDYDRPNTPMACF
jgi:hypothetical protein